MMNEKELLNLMAIMTQQEKQRTETEHKEGRRKGSYNTDIKAIMETIQNERQKGFLISVEYIENLNRYYEKDIKTKMPILKGEKIPRKKINLALKHLGLKTYKTIFSYKQLSNKKKEVVITDFSNGNNGKIRFKVLKENQKIGIDCKLRFIKVFRMITETGIEEKTFNLFEEKKNGKTLKIQKQLRQDLREKIRQELNTEKFNLFESLAENRVHNWVLWENLAIKPKT